MKLLKLTALPLDYCYLSCLLASCEPDAEMDRTTDFEKKCIVMSGAQETRRIPSAAIGRLDVFYTKDTRYTQLYCDLVRSYRFCITDAYSWPGPGRL